MAYPETLTALRVAGLVSRIVSVRDEAELAGMVRPAGPVDFALSSLAIAGANRVGMRSVLMVKPTRLGASCEGRRWPQVGHDCYAVHDDVPAVA